MSSIDAAWTPPDNGQIEAIVVGGGFSGLYSLYKLRKEGIDAKLLEAGKGLGGVWNYNRYPGARVDSEVPYYQYSIPEVYKTWNWSERFPGQEELLRYFEHVASTLRLYEHMAFEYNVTGCDFDTQAKTWTLKIENGKTIRCKYLIVAAGASYKKHFPTFEGLDQYEGDLLHTSAFPEGGYDFNGKRIAVVGQGASGIQVVQETSKVAEKLTIFIRTANMAIPMRQRKLSSEEQTALKSIYEHLFRLCRESRSGMPYNTDGRNALETPKAEREAKWEELWERGGFNFQLAGFGDFLTNQDASDLMYEFWKNKVRARISDPVKAEIFAPTKAPHPFGTKRPSLEQDYYECVDRSNVEVVDLHKVDIKSFNKKGMVTSDGTVREFDVIVLATGYDAVTGSLTNMGLRDVNGLDMKERWSEGVRTWLGTTVPGFPNMFMVYSPQAPTALANGTTIIEAQADWVADTILKMKKEGVEVIDAQPSAAEKWASDIQEMNEKTLFPLTNSWYMGANIPGKKREQLNYLAGVNAYEKECKDAQKNWSGFNLSPAQAA